MFENVILVLFFKNYFHFHPSYFYFQVHSQTTVHTYLHIQSILYCVQLYVLHYLIFIIHFLFSGGQVPSKVFYCIIIHHSLLLSRFTFIAISFNSIVQNQTLCLSLYHYMNCSHPIDEIVQTVPCTTAHPIQSAIHCTLYL